MKEGGVLGEPPDEEILLQHLPAVQIFRLGGREEPVVGDQDELVLDHWKHSLGKFLEKVDLDKDDLPMSVNYRALFSYLERS